MQALRQETDPAKQAQLLMMLNPEKALLQNKPQPMMNLGPGATAFDPNSRQPAFTNPAAPPKTNLLERLMNQLPPDERAKAQGAYINKETSPSADPRAAQMFRLLERKEVGQVVNGIETMVQKDGLGNTWDLQGNLLGGRGIPPSMRPYADQMFGSEQAPSQPQGEVSFPSSGRSSDNVSSNNPNAVALQAAAGTNVDQSNQAGLRGSFIGTPTQTQTNTFGPVKKREAQDTVTQRMLQSEFESRHPNVKTLNTMKPQFMSATQYMAEIAKATKEGGRKEVKSSSADRALLFTFQKMIDPNDRVSEGDMRALVKLGGLDERFVQYMEAISRGAVLPDRVRNDIYKVMRRTFTTLNSQVKEVEERYKKRFISHKLSPDLLIRVSEDLD